MPSRGRANNSRHDQRVKQEAAKLQRAGWNVRADLPGFSKPDSVGENSRIPDIQATKQGHTKLIEVETPSSKGADKDQQTTFRRSAAQKPNTKFELIETD